MPLDTVTMSALRHCIDRFIPFALMRRPGGEAVFMADPDPSLPPLDNSAFIINGWNTSAAGNIIIRNVVDAVDVQAFTDGCPGSATPWSESTRREDYIRTTARLIERLRHTGNKVVRARVICARAKVDAAGVFSDLADAYPDAFCHCSYTPSTGFWLGATPEVLADIRDGHLSTMALAGTRTAGGGNWDEKNRREHAYVVDFITVTLRSLGINPVVYAARTLRYGLIEHLLTPVRADMCGVDTERLLDALSPTPAVCGMPRDEALADIDACEDFPRRCYAGYVAVRGADDSLSAWVNLRCAHFDAESYCIYVGGGITADSDAAAEWRETEAKAAGLLSAVRRRQTNNLSENER